MKLAEQIIENLSDQGSSLTDALLKTKILLHKIGHKELVEWVNHELTGYPDGTQLPPYRILSSRVLANIASIAWIMQAHPIPIAHLSDKQRASLTVSEMAQPLSVLEKMTESDTSKLRADIPMELYELLGKNLANGVGIQRAWCEVTNAQVNSIFIQVRSRLLDFLLEINEKLPGDMKESEIKDQSKAIDAPGMFRNAIFGDHATIVMGTGNSTSVSTVNLKGNFPALAKLLKDNQVAEVDIAQLETALADDAGNVDEEGKRFGPAVTSWTQRMLEKVTNTSWQIELAIAANLLTTALQNYYGWLR